MKPETQFSILPVNVWLLCVVLHAGMHGQCISAWPTEQACDEEKSKWTREALAWTRRSNLAPSAAAICR